MESEARKELEAVFTKELKNQRKIGFDIGFAYGEEEGVKKHWNGSNANCSKLCFYQRLHKKDVSAF